MPVDPLYLYCTATDLDGLQSLAGRVGTLDDDNDGVLNSDELVFQTKAIKWATSKVNFYLLASYDAVDLANSYLVNNWCVICAAKWLSSHRGNPPPESIDELYDEAIEDMKLVHEGLYQVPDIGTRDALWPAWSNVRVSNLYALRKVRVERWISDRYPTPYQQNIDIVAEQIIEPNG